ncbi:leucine-rich repeat-containing protein [Tanacetum coccineum]
MEVAKIRMLKWTCGKTIFDMIPNGVFRTNLQVVTIVNKMREGRLRWFGHVKRRPQLAPVRIMEALIVDGARRRGRPKLTWEDRLKTDLKEMLLSEDMTCDRSAWRSRIRVLLSAFCAALCSLYALLSPVFLEAVPLSSGRGVIVYISPPPYLASTGLGINQKQIFFQETNASVIFILHHEVHQHGERAFYVDCVGLKSTLKNMFVYHLAAESMDSMDTDTSLTFKSVTEVHTQLPKNTLMKNYLTVPSAFAGDNGILSLFVGIIKDDPAALEVQDPELGWHDHDAHKVLKVVLNDPGALDCSICLKPLWTPVFQCENAHLACSSCCSKLKSKCSCCGYNYNRCRGLEKVIESIGKISCKYAKYGCKETMPYNEKTEHEKDCPRATCFCPHPSSCSFASTSENLYLHFGIKHDITRFTYNTTFSLCVDINQELVFLQEESGSVIFILSHQLQKQGRIVVIGMVLRDCDLSTGDVIGIDVSCGNIVLFHKLVSLDMFVNQFTLESHVFNNLLRNATNLEELSLINVNISVVLPASLNISSFLKFLNLSNTGLQGKLPHYIFNLPSLEKLDLSYNSFTGDIPLEISLLPKLVFLDLSSNGIDNLRPVLPTYLNVSSLKSLDLRRTNLQGNVPDNIFNLRYLELLNLSENNLTGPLPSRLFTLPYGTIPNVHEDCRYLEGLILNGNQLEGEVPSSFSKCQSLRVVDLGNNHLNGTFPEWLGELPNLQVLVLKSNKLRGIIQTSSSVKFSFPSSLYYSFVIAVKGVDQYFAQLWVEYTILDLSENSFEREIPGIIGKLNSLKVLNLSHNSLNGRIPDSLGKISEVESLYLSWNQLTGQIPQSLADIKGLGVLNLSQNRLVGLIPEGTQFNTFEDRSFAGNLGLCGFPLPKKCSERTHKQQLEEHENHEEKNGFTWEVVTLGYGCGTLLGLVTGYLMLSTRKVKWFNTIADAGEQMILQLNKRKYVSIGR